MGNGNLLSSSANMTPLQVPSAISQGGHSSGPLVTDMLSSALSSESLGYGTGQLSQIPSLSHLGRILQYTHVNI